MSKLHHLPLFVDAYITDTRHLTASQHGAYLLLLMMAWNLPDCALPNDDVKLSRWACMDRRTWLKNKDTVMSFWQLGEDQKFRQQRLSKERKYVAQLVSKNSAAGQASALKRKESLSTSVQPNVNENSTPIPIPIQVSNSKGYLTEFDLKDPTWKTISEEDDDKANPDNRRMFYGEVIKLREKDYNQFARLAGYELPLEEENFREELRSRDGWLASKGKSMQKSWFMSTKKHMENLGKP